MTGALVIDPDSEPKLHDRLAGCATRGLSCEHVTALGLFVLARTVCYQTQLITADLP